MTPAVTGIKFRLQSLLVWFQLTYLVSFTTASNTYNSSPCCKPVSSQALLSLCTLACTVTSVWNTPFSFFSQNSIHLPVPTLEHLLCQASFHPSMQNRSYLYLGSNTTLSVCLIALITFFENCVHLHYLSLLREGSLPTLSPRT